MSQTEKWLSWILKGGLLLTPFLVFVVTRSLYFPFISGKNFAFRILIEVLTAIWVFAALRYPRFRPRSSALNWSVIVFIAVMGIATAFALSPYRSFWSSYERMEGYVALLHFLLYFLLLGTVFTSERDWYAFFHTSLGASVIVAGYSVLQLAGKLEIHQGGTRVDATLGNATYLAAYMLFHLFFLIWFFLREERVWLRLCYAAAFILEVTILYHTATRGAIFGFLGGFVILAVLLATLHRGAIRRWALTGLGIVVLLPILFLLVRNASFVSSSPVLERFASISLTDTTTQSRFTIWKMAFDGWKELPILGWGQESFVYIFSKYYQPSLWRQEPWFDRAHNVFLDWLTAGGILGLMSYLAMFGAAFWLLVRALRPKATDAVTFSVLASLLFAHFFENLFVFDNLTSYLLFFAVIAYIHTISMRARSTVAPNQAVVRSSIPVGVQTGAVAILAVLLVLVVYFGNVKPIMAGADILSALNLVNQQEPSGKVDAILAKFQDGIDKHTFGTTELREQVSQVATYIARDQALAAQDKTKYFQFAISELESQRREFPSDVRAKAFLATLDLSAGRQSNALEVINEAIAISPKRQQFYFLAAEAYLNTGDGAKALDSLRYAYSLAPDYPEALINLATVLILDGKDPEAEALIQKQYGVPTISEQRLAQAYTQIRAYAKAARVWELIASGAPNDYRNRAQLGIAYAQAGRVDDAIHEIEKAIELEPRFKAQGDQLISQIRGGGK